MDLPKRVLPQGERATRSSSPRRSPKAMRTRAMEADENVSPECSVAAGAASPQRKKVLGQRNGGGGREAASPVVYQPKTAPSPPSLGGRGAGTYDPKTNYTTPRPEFLRYNPERTREIRLRLEREVENERSSTTSGTVASEAVSSCSSARGSDSECDDVDEEEVVPVHRGGWARQLFLLLVAVACSFCYIYCMSSVPFPASPEERQVVSLLEPVDMSGSEDVFEAAGGQVMHRDSDDCVHLHGPGDSPINFMVIATMGLADVCPNVPFGELTCQIGDESSGNVNDLKEDSELGEQKAEVIDGSFEYAEREVACSGADAIEDSIASIQCADMEEGKLRLINQEEGEDYTNHFMPQLVFVEKIMDSESEKPDNEEGLESELDQESEPWEEYENTAEAVKAICVAVKKSWPSMEPRLLQMLACLSVAGFVAVMFKYSQRPRKVPVPVSKRIPSMPPTRVPVLDPYRIAQLPVFPSRPAVKLPMFPSEQHVQSPSPKPDPSVSLQVPLIVHGNHDQKIQQGVSDISSMDHHKEIDSLKPPVVELLGEFSFVDAGSSRGRSNKDPNWHAEDATVLESLSSRNDVVKMQKESSKIQSPSVQRSIKKENAEVEKMDATPTPTPLRRSSRVRKLTST